MIFANYSGRLGNILFKYTFCKLLSHLSGVPFTNFPSRYEAKDHYCSLEAIENYSNNAIIDFKKSHLTTDNLCINYFNKYILGQKDQTEFVISELLEIAKKKDILVDGYPHNSEYFIPYKKWIKENIKIIEGDYKKTNDLVIHVRIGDIFEESPVVSTNRKISWSYPLKIIDNLLSNLKFKNCTIVTDTPDYPELLRIKEKYNCEIISNDLLYDFRTLVNAKRLIITPSTFSWWAAFLSDSQEIYYPYDIGLWSLGWDTNSKILPFNENVNFYNRNGKIFKFNKYYPKNNDFIELKNPIEISICEKKILISKLFLSVYDYEIEKKVYVKINNSRHKLLLWSGTVYDLAGDYTRKQVEDRVLELLGEDISKEISKLF
jgi:hypothetical protein